MFFFKNILALQGLNGAYSLLLFITAAASNNDHKYEYRDTKRNKHFWNYHWNGKTATVSDDCRRGKQIALNAHIKSEGPCQIKKKLGLARLIPPTSTLFFLGGGIMYKNPTKTHTKNTHKKIPLRCFFSAFFKLDKTPQHIVQLPLMHFWASYVESIICTVDA